MVELTMVMPVLLSIGLFALEFGNFVYTRHLIHNGLRDAARYLTGFPQGTKDTEGRNIAARAVTSGGTNRVSWWNPGDVTISYSSVANAVGSCTSGGNPVKCYRGGNSIVLVTVSTNVTYQSLGFLGFRGLGTVPLQASHQERLFGVR